MAKIQAHGKKTGRKAAYMECYGNVAQKSEVFLCGFEALKIEDGT